MTGEKLRSLRRDHKPSKEDGDLLGPGEEEAAAAPGAIFTGGRGSSGKGGRAGGHRIFSNHHHHQRLPLKGGPAGGGTGPAAEPERCPAHFPVHECVFKVDVRRLSALIRTQGIGQKDSHGERRARPCSGTLGAVGAPSPPAWLPSFPPPVGSCLRSPGRTRGAHRLIHTVPILLCELLFPSSVVFCRVSSALGVSFLLSSSSHLFLHKEGCEAQAVVMHCTAAQGWGSHPWGCSEPWGCGTEGRGGGRVGWGVS